MSSDIETWFYGLDHEIDEPGVSYHRGSKRIFDKFSQTTSSSTFVAGNKKMDKARGVKMVADELLAATGAVVGATAAIFATPGAIGLAVPSGEQAGRNLASFMWRVIH